MYNALIVDPDSKARVRLKEAAKIQRIFGRINVSSSLLHAKQRLQEGETECDVVFLAEQFDMEDIAEFIKVAKKTEFGEDCAYILVIKSEDTEGTTEATSVLAGVHGILQAPYSVNRLQEIVSIASRVKGENEVRRRKDAIRTLIQKLVKEYDKITSYMSKGMNVTRSVERFQERCQQLKKFQDDEAFAMYCDIAIDVFQKSRPKKRDYGGASKRIRDRMMKKLQEQYDKDMADDESEENASL
ncbi:MAG: hypothetical protein H6619_04135 [Deltaproteobacteria bacterium]|nr:hypothetical protein [Deltaproteobacteria bacterium]